MGARDTRRQLRCKRIIPLISPPPRESTGPVVAFALTGILVGLWAVAYLVAGLGEVVMTTSGR